MVITEAELATTVVVVADTLAKRDMILFCSHQVTSTPETGVTSTQAGKSQTPQHPTLHHLEHATHPAQQDWVRVQMIWPVKFASNRGKEITKKMLLSPRDKAGVG